MDSGRPFLRAFWRNLAILNYEVDPPILKKYLPQGTEIDTFHGKTFVSMVAFQFLKTRVMGVAIPFHCNFEEINLRFYVKYQVPGGELQICFRRCPKSMVWGHCNLSAKPGWKERDRISRHCSGAAGKPFKKAMWN